MGDLNSDMQQAMAVMFEGELRTVSEQLAKAATTDEVLSIPLSAAGRIEPLAQRFSASAGVGCKAGCSWCCRGLKVDVSVPEAVLIADFLRLSYEESGNFTDYAAALTDVAAELREMSGRERWIAQTPCAFLDDETGECSIYDVRPLACRAHSSLDAGSCERAAGDRTERLTIKKFVVTAQLYGLAAEAQREAYKAADLDARSFELTNAVALVLGEPEAGRKWRSGSRLFDAAVIPSDGADREAAEIVARRAGLVPRTALVRREGADRNARKRARKAERNARRKGRSK